MLKYLVVLLDRTSAAFCHADNPYGVRELMPLPVLQEALLFALKENLSVQFVYPDYELSDEYVSMIDSVDHIDIRHGVGGDVCVLNGMDGDAEIDGDNVVIRTTSVELIDNLPSLIGLMSRAAHVAVVLTDMPSMSDERLGRYGEFLSDLEREVAGMIQSGVVPQINLLTDRLFLAEMNNCNAGWESITLAPDGKFYVCPAFYLEGEETAIGDLKKGLDIKNAQLYRLDYAPLCRICDAYQCKRCIYLNRKTTLEVNTPSHEQCVVSHLERNAARALLAVIRQSGSTCMNNVEIKEITYLDPLDIIKK